MSLFVRPLVCLMSLMGAGGLEPPGVPAGASLAAGGLRHMAGGFVHEDPAAPSAVEVLPGAMDGRDALRRRVVLTLQRMGPEATLDGRSGPAALHEAPYLAEPLSGAPERLTAPPRDMLQIDGVRPVRLSQALPAAMADTALPGPVVVQGAAPEAPLPRPAKAALAGVQVALNSRALDAIRGGYSGLNGLQVSFGIERSVYINGALMTTTSLNLNGQGQPAGTGHSLALIQTGAGNSVSPQLLLSSEATGTVIQNSLNDQRIQAMTVINATVNSLQLLRSLNLQTSIRESVTDSLRR